MHSFEVSRIMQPSVYSVEKGPMKVRPEDILDLQATRRTTRRFSLCSFDDRNASRNGTTHSLDAWPRSHDTPHLWKSRSQQLLKGVERLQLSGIMNSRHLLTPKGVLLELRNPHGVGKRALREIRTLLQQVSTHPSFHVIPQGSGKSRASSRKCKHGAGDSLVGILMDLLKLLDILCREQVVLIARVKSLSNNIGMRLEQTVMQMPTATLLVGHAS